MPPKASPAAKGKGDAGPASNAAGEAAIKAKMEELAAVMALESEERNFAQVERDKVIEFWEITKAELVVARAALRNAQRDAEVANEAQAGALRVQVQKVKHLQFEHAAALAALQLEKEQALKDAAAVAAARQDELIAEKRAVQAALAASENALAAEVGKVQLEAARAGTALREELAAASEAAAAAAASSLAAEREAAEARRARELDAASSRREAQVSALEKNHAQSLGELKDWYDATTSEQLGAIKRLGGELVEYRRKEAALEAAVTELTAENKRLADVAYKATLEAEVLRPGAASSDKDKAAAAAATARAAKAERALKQAEWDLEVKTQLVVALAASKEELQRALDAAEATNRRPGRLLSNAEASLAR